ncbi:insulin gene enhancer protein isl-1-like isoform X2 [Lineus longissimus]|uniref:insulin gene enhancer protein isl-1-like isoform X2 n=1 Tax=Lineus longissimus TaxID=88925 RepID=UPI00315CE6A0
MSDAQPKNKPILVINNLNKKRRVSLCVGCGSQIQDQYILRVAPDLEWHAACLKCADCNQYLDETCTCFVRDGKTYCKRDYVRLFGTKCAKCSVGFSKNDFVMRARNKIYHIDCFRCVACSRQLIPGDEFALREDGLFCKADHEVVERASGQENHGSPSSINNNNNDEHKGLQLADGGHGKLRRNKKGHAEQMPNSRSGGIRPHVHKTEQKTTRVRTVLNEKQLHTLRTCYNANPRPDALMKEQLVEMTNLSPRVIRVWFQNKRCKDKKRSILMKQMQQQQEKNGNRLQGPLQGVPMVASSPVRHESNLQGQQVEVQSYQPPWKALSEFAMQSEIEQPPFQQLVHSFDRPSSMSGGDYGWGEDDSNLGPESICSEFPASPSDLSSPVSM